MNDNNHDQNDNNSHNYAHSEFGKCSESANNCEHMLLNNSTSSNYYNNTSAQIPVDHSMAYGSAMSIPMSLPMPAPAMKKKPASNVRKGKWTLEEERYTNKVIEVFNAGMLRLSDAERGVTLRAYLANKLGCDPMRITKKYTGASCLGKRVYHPDHLIANSEEVSRAHTELQNLETMFRLKLDQIIRRKNGLDDGTDPNNYMVSTPAIDAMLCPTAPGPTVLATMQQQQTQSQHLSQASIMHGNRPSRLTDHITRLFPNGMSLQQPMTQQQAALLMLINHNEHMVGNMAANPASRSIVEQNLAGQRRSLATALQQDENASTVSNNAKRYKMEVTEVKTEQGFQLPMTRPSSSPEPRQASTVHFSRQLSSSGANAVDTDVALNGQDNHNNTVDQSNTTKNTAKRLRCLDTEQTAAASSLLGFFNHLNKIGSSEDLVEFFEGVQKTVKANGGSSGQSEQGHASSGHSIPKSRSTGNLRVSTTTTISRTTSFTNAANVAATDSNSADDCALDGGMSRKRSNPELAMMW